MFALKTIFIKEVSQREKKTFLLCVGGRGTIQNGCLTFRFDFMILILNTFLGFLDCFVKKQITGKKFYVK